jgi:hypothetical protein
VASAFLRGDMEKAAQIALEHLASEREVLTAHIEENRDKSH